MSNWENRKIVDMDNTYGLGVCRGGTGAPIGARRLHRGFSGMLSQAHDRVTRRVNLSCIP